MIPGEEVDVAFGVSFCGDDGLFGGWCVWGAVFLVESGALTGCGVSNEELFGVDILKEVCGIGAFKGGELVLGMEA